MTMMVASRTSTPTSITVVATRAGLALENLAISTLRASHFMVHAPGLPCREAGFEFVSDFAPRRCRFRRQLKFAFGGFFIDQGQTQLHLLALIQGGFSRSMISP